MIAIAIFTSCNIDSLLVLMVLFCSPAFPVTKIVISQFISQAILIMASMALAHLAFMVSPAYTGLLGFFPLTLGVTRLMERREHQQFHIVSAHEEVHSTRSSSIASITLLMLSIGGDNLSVYIPIFTVHPTPEVLSFSGVLLVMTGIWCVVAHFLAHHRLVARMVHRYGEPLLPWNMIGLGAYIHRFKGIT
jgi:cadmium resistance protein CadD (predicted permease)